MSQWFRFYGESLNDPKVQRLPGETYKLWVNLLCIASQNDGVVKKGDDTAFQLRMMPEEAEEAIQALVKRGLLEDRGEFYVPHNWDKRQYKSDNSAERVAKHRTERVKRVCNVTEAVTVTPPEAETDTETKDADEALALSDRLLPLLGQDPKHPDPGFYEAPRTVRKWLNQGWPPPIIEASVREQIARKQGGPPSRMTYFEKGIADAIARHSAPLPQGKPGNGSAQAKSGNVVEAAANFRAKLAQFDAGFEDGAELRGAASAADVRLLSQG